MKHDFRLTPKGDIDTFALEVDPHNGPYCIRCASYFCEHCHPEVYEEECPSGQLAFKEEDVRQVEDAR